LRRRRWVDGEWEWGSDRVTGSVVWPGSIGFVGSKPTAQ
jgi:hypothetical protein